jgi:hypothetical protein
VGRLAATLRFYHPAREQLRPGAGPRDHRSRAYSWTAVPFERRQADALPFHAELPRLPGLRSRSTRHGRDELSGHGRDRGAIIDARTPYLHAENQAPKTLAESSALFHASQFTGIPVEELGLANTFLVAVPRAEAIGWAAIVVRGLSQVATVVVEADPAEPDLLPLLHFSRSEVEGLADTVQVTVRTEDLNSDITMGDPITGTGIDPADVDELFDMTPLLGSTEADQFRLGTERVVAYDASMAMTNEELGDLPVVSADAPSFLASPGTSTFRAQSHFSLVSNAFARTDMLMAGKWESALPLVNVQSVIPPGEFFPRAIIHADYMLPCVEGAPACVDDLAFPFDDGAPAEYQQPLGMQPFEVLATMGLKSGNRTSLVAHEFGHVIDLFAHPGFISGNAACTGDPGCMASCDENTTDEAVPLTETFASVVAIWLGHELTAVGQDSMNCSYVPDVSLNSTNDLPHNQGCHPAGEPFPRLIRDDDPSCPSDDLCDKPSGLGFVEIDDVFVPTGACNRGGVDGGYRVDSAFQALWELLHEQTCSETPPFTCQPLTALSEAGNSGDIQGGALLYAARVNSMTYKGFFNDMAVYVACNYGEAAYFSFNDVACHHSLRDCDAGVPLNCEVCGDNQRQGDEACDGADLGGSTCEGLGFDGGVLLCNDSCEFDTSMCTTSASTGDESGVPTSGAVPTTSGGTESSTTDQGSATTGGGGDEGCNCQDTHPSDWPAWLIIVGLLARRRRSGKKELMAALASCALVFPGTGCSGKESPGASAMTSAGTSSGEPTTTASTGPDTASGSSGAVVPTSLYGVYHDKRGTDGLKWEQPIDQTTLLIWWINVMIEQDSSLLVEFYFCGGPPDVQNYTWEPDGEGIRVVPPNGEGTSFKWGNSEVWEVSIKPGEMCGEIFVQVHQVGAEEPFSPKAHVPGHLCTTNVSQTECEFEFKWCEGPPAPPVCE